MSRIFFDNRKTRNLDMKIIIILKTNNHKNKISEIQEIKI